MTHQVLQLGSNFASFFEKLADMLERITSRLPLYERNLDIIREHAESIAQDVKEAAKWQDILQCLSKSLAHVYADMIKVLY